MGERPQIERLLFGLYDARVGGDLDAVCLSFLPEAVFRFSGAGSTSPTLVTAVGIDEFRPLLSTLIKTFKLSEQTILTMIVDGGKVAVHWRAKIHSRITGVAKLTEFVDLVDVRDDRIASYTEFFVPLTTPKTVRRTLS